MKNKISPSENPSIAPSRRLATPYRNPEDPKKKTKLQKLKKKKTPKQIKVKRRVEWVLWRIEWVHGEKRE